MYETILGRLRPLQAIGLDVAIDRLVAFWRSRRPEIVFAVTVSVEDDQIGNDLKETIYRVVQEATSNAIRHGRTDAGRHRDHARDDADDIRVEVTDDGIGMPADSVTGRRSDTTWPDWHAGARDGDGRLARDPGRAATEGGFR